MTIKKVEVCPGFGEQEKVITPYSGDKFDPSITIARNSDPIYDFVDKTQSGELEEPSEDAQIAIY